ncbi:unnamed protein product [Amoebophrya sp. A25]|nr:unnamed protein product [Amoebophrya sp. A25]|eukprot:GSA25T00022187001.1
MASSTSLFLQHHLVPRMPSRATSIMGHLCVREPSRWAWIAIKNTKHVGEPSRTINLGRLRFSRKASSLHGVALSSYPRDFSSSSAVIAQSKAGREGGGASKEDYVGGAKSIVNADTRKNSGTRVVDVCEKSDQSGRNKVDLLQHGAKDHDHDLHDVKEQDVHLEVQQGFITYWAIDRNYGFIKPDNALPSTSRGDPFRLIFHFRHVVRKQLKQLQAGDRIQFKLEPNPVRPGEYEAREVAKVGTVSPSNGKRTGGFTEVMNQEEEGEKNAPAGTSSSHHASSVTFVQESRVSNTPAGNADTRRRSDASRAQEGGKEITYVNTLREGRRSFVVKDPIPGATYYGFVQGRILSKAYGFIRPDDAVPSAEGEHYRVIFPFKHLVDERLPIIGDRVAFQLQQNPIRPSEFEAVAVTGGTGRIWTPYEPKDGRLNDVIRRLKQEQH